MNNGYGQGFFGTTAEPRRGRLSFGTLRGRPGGSWSAGVNLWSGAVRFVRVASLLDRGCRRQLVEIDVTHSTGGQFDLGPTPFDLNDLAGNSCAIVTITEDKRPVD